MFYKMKISTLILKVANLKLAAQHNSTVLCSGQENLSMKKMHWTDFHELECTDL